MSALGEPYPEELSSSQARHLHVVSSPDSDKEIIAIPVEVWSRLSSILDQVVIVEDTEGNVSGYKPDEWGPRTCEQTILAAAVLLRQSRIAINPGPDHI